MTTKWTDTKQHTLEVNYPFMTAHELAEYMNEPVSRIRYRAYKHGLNKHWSDADEQYLIDNYKHSDIDDLVFELDRTSGAIYSHARVLGLEKEYGNREHWSKDDIAYLKENHRIMSSSELAKVLNKSEGSTRYRIRQLGLSQLWSSEDDEYLIENYKQCTAQDIATHLNRGVSAIYSRAYQLGVTNR